MKDIDLLILINGTCAGVENKDEVAKQIKNFANELKALHHDLKIRPFSVVFIKLGNDDATTQRLRYLDDYLHKEGIP